MSKTFSARSGVSQRGWGGAATARGRGGRENSQPGVQLQGQGVTPRQRQPSQPPARGGRSPGATRVAMAGRGRSSSLGPPTPGGARTGVAAGPWDTGQPPNSIENRTTYNAAHSFTVISPDEKRRKKLMEQAQKETKQYEQYKQRNKPSSFSYVGTAGGGEVVHDESSARQLQIQSHQMQNKANRLIRQQDRKFQGRQIEERELQQRKDAARQKTERNSLQQQNRRQNYRSEMQRVNQAFLDRLEAKSKETT